MGRNYKRFLVVSDVHSNKRALEAVLNDVHGPLDGRYCAGDIIGYGPHPNEVIDLLRENEFECVLGNHDAAVREITPFRFNGLAEEAIHLNDKILTRASREFLRGLYAIPLVHRGHKIAVVHGSFAPDDRDYHTKYTRAEKEQTEALEALTKPEYNGILVGIVGHTHIPMIGIGRYGAGNEFPVSYNFFEDGDTITAKVRRDRPKRHRRKRLRILINPGSVGQPRDGTPDAKYALVLTSKNLVTIHFKSVLYDIAATQKEMLKKGFPKGLIERLAIGR